jgi:hypothetical protein
MNDYEALATKQLASLEARLPKLVVQLAKDAPADSVVVRDGVELGRLSLSTQLPCDPGAHEIVVRAGGQERRYPLTLAESETKTIEVTGPVVAKTAAVPDNAKKPPTDEGAKAASSAASPDTPAATHGLGTQRIAALVTGGAGVVTMGISLALISSAKASWQEAADRCPNNQCDDQSAIDDADAARKRGNVATGVFLAGAAATVTGGVLWFTAPSTRGTALRVIPLIGTSSGGLLVRGSY